MGKNILLVDDFENTIFVTGLTLEQKGYNIFKALSGEQALKILDLNQIDLIITDYNMPGMNGVELVEKIKSRIGLGKIPILMLSTETKQTVKDRAFDIGVTAWVKKPFKIEQFLMIVEKTLL
jgi:two-component system chemotaxis response regulator CheY